MIAAAFNHGNDPWYEPASYPEPEDPDGPRPTPPRRRSSAESLSGPYARERGYYPASWRTKVLWEPSLARSVECDLGLEGGAAGGPAQRLKQRRTDGQGQYRGEHRPAQVPAERGGQTVGEEADQVVRQRIARLEGDPQ